MSFYLQQKKSKKIIVFITGWGMDEKPTLFLDDGKYDILTLYDYPSLKKFDFNFDNYEEIVLIAWSLGVLAANIYFGERTLKFDKCIAINGTGAPVDDRFGIPHKKFDLTHKNWSEKARRKFNVHMCGNPSVFEKFSLNSPQRIVNNQRYELEWCYKKAIGEKKKACVGWDVSIVGIKDRIFPPENMIEYWKLRDVSIKEINQGHFPFLQWNNWTDIINDLKE